MLLRAKTLSKKVLDVMSWPFFCYPLLQIEESTKLLTLPSAKQILELPDIPLGFKATGSVGCKVNKKGQEDLLKTFQRFPNI